MDLMWPNKVLVWRLISLAVLYHVRACHVIIIIMIDSDHAYIPTSIHTAIPVDFTPDPDTTWGIIENEYNVARNLVSSNSTYL